MVIVSPTGRVEKGGDVDTVRLRLSGAEQRQALAALYRNNLEVLRGALEYCDRARIRLYRVTSNLFPLCDEPAGTAVLEAMADRLGEIGPMAGRLGIRVVAHPDQFVVLSSENFLLWAIHTALW